MRCSILCVVVAAACVAADEDATNAVYSNNNVNLGNLANLGLDDRGDRGPKLTGPNVCTKQEP